MMTKREYCELAKKYSDMGMNCAQSLLLAFRDRTGMDEKTCWGVASGLGGGVRCGGICGAITGSVMVLGMLHPHTPENGGEGKAYSAKLTKEFERRFAQQFGYMNCRELLAVKDLEPTSMTKELGVAGHCTTLIVSAAELLFDMLEELEKE